MATVFFVSLGASSVIVATATSPLASVTAISGAMVASRAFQVIIAVTVTVPSMFPATVPSLAVSLPITRPIAVFVSVSAFGAFATMAIIVFGGRIFGIIGSG